MKVLQFGGDHKIHIKLFHCGGGEGMWIHCPKKYFTMFDKSLAFDVYYMKETEGRIVKERIIALWWNWFSMFCCHVKESLFPVLAGIRERGFCWPFL